MPRVSPQITNQLTTGRELAQDQQKTARQQTDQNNAGPQVLIYPKRGGGLRIPRGMKRGDMLSRPTTQGVALRTAADRGTSKEVDIPSVVSQLTQAIIDSSVHYKGVQTGTAAPTTAEFPEDGDYGWFINTTPAPDAIYFVFNNAGVITTISASTIAIAFTNITGTITNDQHGALGRETSGNSPHHTNATTSEPGFMSTTHFDMLDDATSAATADTLVLRDGSADITARAFYAEIAGGGGGGFFDAEADYRVDGTRVVSNRQAAITDALTGGSATAANCASRINLILDAMRPVGHGLIDV